MSPDASVRLVDTLQLVPMDQESPSPPAFAMSDQSSQSGSEVDTASTTSCSTEGSQPPPPPPETCSPPEWLCVECDDLKRACTHWGFKPKAPTTS